MDNKEFFDKVAQMRTQQKAFFNSRPSSEERKTALVNSKRLEKEIDNEIARVQEIMARKETYLVQYQDVDGRAIKVENIETATEKDGTTSRIFLGKTCLKDGMPSKVSLHRYIHESNVMKVNVKEVR